jgi:hypothetical protein
MKKRFAATDCDYGRSQSGQLIDALKHRLQRNRFGKIVILIAIFAGQITTPYRNDVSQQWMVDRN